MAAPIENAKRYIKERNDSQLTSRGGEAGRTVAPTILL